MVTTPKASRTSKQTQGDAIATDAPVPAVKAEAASKIVAKAEPAEKKKKDLAKGKAPKHAKSHKPKMIRDSFAMPESDYSKLGLLKSKCLENGVEVKKSELLRAGLTALAKMSVNTLIKVVSDVEKLKTGRPRKQGS